MTGERQRLRPWLESQINSGQVPQLIWLDKVQGIFKVPWKHAGKPGFVLERDAVLFREWARHTGKYRDGEQADPSTWKTRFRCAINKLPDIDEIKEQSNLDGDEPYRVYRFLPKGAARTERAEMSPYPEMMTTSPAPVLEIKQEDMAGSYGGMDNESDDDVDIMQQNIIDNFQLPNEDPVDPYFSCSPETDCQMLPTDFYYDRPPQVLNPMTQEINDIIGMNPEAVELNIKIYYHEKQVFEKVVSNRYGCRIHSGADLTRVVGLTDVYGPQEVEQVQFPDQDSPSTIMENLNRGLLLQWENNSIIATRFCQARVYASGGCLGSSIETLVRKQQTKVFDYDVFLAGLAEYRLARAAVPLYEVFFSFGQQPATNSTVDPGVLITVSVTHLTAKASISKMGSASDVLVSIEDEGDRLAKNLQQMLRLQTPMVPVQPQDGCGF